MKTHCIEAVQSMPRSINSLDTAVRDANLYNLNRRLQTLLSIIYTEQLICQRKLENADVMKSRSHENGYQHKFKNTLNLYYSKSEHQNAGAQTTYRLVDLTANSNKVKRNFK
ncbi:conserved hypothetical protein [Trichinella spiralis]|uniref:hypothetical protein n=1 Tax=Trichinella spiralis TaxID=6334 RepID=UPI0001EFBE69|nr:conserved hypothetical protein [Trichinella spiralis]